MDNQFITLLYPLLDKLKNGSIIRKIVALIFRIWGVLSAILVIGMGLISLVNRLSLENFMGFLMLSSLAIIYVQIYLYHAKEIDELGDSPFTISPIIAIVVKTIGEVQSLGLLYWGVSISLVIAFYDGEKYNLSHMFNSIPIIGEIMGELVSKAPSLLSVFILLFLGIVISFIILMLAYFIAERIIVSTDMATNMRILVSSSALRNKPDATAIHADHSPQTTIHSEGEAYAALEKLADLKEKGILSAEEFEKEKTALLKNL